jgi:multidrug resistance efflux pump
MTTESPKTSRRTRIAAILMFLGLAGAIALQWWMSRPPRSIQAFVNTGVSVIRAPIAGRIDLAPEIRVGRPVEPADDLGVIESDVENPRVSQLLVQERQTEVLIATLEQQLAGTRRRIEARSELIARFALENVEQKRLQEKYHRSQINTVREELRRAVVSAEVAASEVRRTEKLFERGVSSGVALERVVGSGREASADVSAQKARLAQFEAGLEASAAGLQLDGPRTLSEPESRLRQLNTELVDLEQQAADVARRLEGAKLELEVVREQLGSQRRTVVRALNPGVIWSVEAQSGENVAANGRIAQLVDCRDVWVEAFFDESDTARMSIGERVTVKMLYGDMRWEGVVETLRAGAGRVTVGQYVVDPPPEIARRQLPVRVMTARIRVNWGTDLTPEKFCFAGGSVEVVAR